MTTGRKRGSHGDVFLAPVDPLVDEVEPDEVPPKNARTKPIAHGGVRRRSTESPLPDRVSFGHAESSGGGHALPMGRLGALWSGVKLLFGVAVVISLALSVAWGVHRYAMTTSRFAIRKVDVQGAERLKPETVARLAGADRE